MGQATVEYTQLRVTLYLKQSTKWRILNIIYDEEIISTHYPYEYKCNFSKCKIFFIEIFVSVFPFFSFIRRCAILFVE